MGPYHTVVVHYIILCQNRNWIILDSTVWHGKIKPFAQPTLTATGGLAWWFEFPWTPSRESQSQAAPFSPLAAQSFLAQLHLDSRNGAVWQWQICFQHQPNDQKRLFRDSKIASSTCDIFHQARLKVANESYASDLVGQSCIQLDVNNELVEGKLFIESGE